ncbi:MAG: ABC transporter substrate-binding protein [Desulfobacterota bacterium]|nr:ABC transporter substrate-binding protein [Thermodesulfobacteriota bacterium]MDW8001620.1 ABC transporter substrate-binding protein [Deltaproteobacteria bacterium]
MKIKFSFLFAILLLCRSLVFAEDEISVALEFNSHSAAFYVAQGKGIFEKENLKIKSHEAYMTGVALASSLKKGNIEAAFMCLVPAINAYSNGGIRLKIVLGSHLYGFGLVVNPKRVKSVNDLGIKALRIGCISEGSATDLILRRTIDGLGLKEEKVLSSVVRMNPQNMLIALRSGSIDAAFMPEHFVTLAERDGLKVLLTAKDIWPNFQGSVIVVKEEVLKNKREAVKKLVRATKKATHWINTQREDSSRILARYLSLEGSKVGFSERLDPKAELSIKEQEALISMSRLEFTNQLNRKVIQETIDYMAKKGYIRESFNAESIIAWDL